MPGFREGAAQKARRRELQRRLGKVVHDLRERHRPRLSQAALAEKVRALMAEEDPDAISPIGSQDGISRLEAGSRQVTPELVEVLARALDTDPLTLLVPIFGKEWGSGEDSTKTANPMVPFLSDALAARALGDLVVLANKAPREDFEAAVRVLDGLVASHVSADREEIHRILTSLWTAAVTSASSRSS